MNQAKMVSVLLPCYNAAQNLVPTLESLFAQTYQDFEVIAIDDGSTDNTLEILKKYPLINIYHFSTNMGLPKALNMALSLAKGEFIQILDSDDLIFPNKIALQVGILEEQKSDIAYCFYEKFAENEGIKQILSCHESIIQDANVELMHQIWFPPTAYLFRKEVAKEIFFDESLLLFNDVLFFWKITKKNKISPVPQVLMQYRVSCQSLSRKGGILVYFTYKYQVLQKIEHELRTQNELCSKSTDALVEAYRDCNRVFVAKNRVLFEECTNKIYGLYKNYIPPKSWKMRLLSQFLGYRRAAIFANILQSLKHKSN